MIWVADLKGARVQAFDAESLDKIGEVATGPVPIRVAASPDGRWIVTSNVGDGSLTLIDAASRKKVRDVPIAGTQDAGQVTILFGPDGKLYAAETGQEHGRRDRPRHRQGAPPSSGRNERRRTGDRTRADRELISSGARPRAARACTSAI